MFVSDLRKTYDTRAIRLGIVTNHYRTEWEWNDELMPAAAARLERWLAAGPGEGALGEVRAALDDDLDSPAAVAAIDAAVERGEGVSQAALLLGVDLEAGPPTLNRSSFAGRDPKPASRGAEP